MDESIAPVKLCSLEAGTPGRGSGLAWACLSAGLILSVVLAVLSDGAYHDDGLAHYLFARWAWDNPRYLLDEWGRPGVTGLLFPVAWMGWLAARLVAALATAAAVWFAYDVARRLRMRGAAFVPLLCYLQPLLLLASYTTLTETAAALYLTAALWCFVRGRRTWAAGLVSLCFVTRYEMLVLLPVWAWALLRRSGSTSGDSGGRRWPAGLLLIWAPVVHNLLGAVVIGRWPFEFVLASAQASSELYGQGTPLTMLVKSMATNGPAIAALALVGLAVRIRGRGVGLAQASFGLYLLTHSVIFGLGAYASGGYPRFLIATSPLAALCALAALGLLFPERNSDHPVVPRRSVLATLALVVVVLWIGVELEAVVVDEAWLFLIEKVRLAVRVGSMLALAMLLWLSVRPTRWPARLLASGAVLITALPLAWLVRPHRLHDDGRRIAEAVAWLRSSDYADAPVIATNIWVSHFLERGCNVVPADSVTLLDDAEAGTVFVWDARYSPTPRFDVQAAALRQDRRWQLLWPAAADEPGDPFACVYLRVPEPDPR